MRVHIVYPQQADIIIAPWTIGNHLVSAFASRGHSVSWADWDSTDEPPGHIDLLLGHPHDEPGRAFERAASIRPKRLVAICPWGNDPQWTARLEELRDRGYWKQLLAITGPEWESSLPAHWCATRLDMAIDSSVWLEEDIEPENRVLYVGCTLPFKGTQYLAAVSEAAPDIDFIHIGPGTIGGRVRSLGILPNGAWRQVARHCPAIIACGVNDANPTVLLEGAALGMLPFATRGAGWGEDLVVRIPDDDPAAAARVIQSTQWKRGLRRAAAEQYTWDRFIATVMRTCESA